MYTYIHHIHIYHSEIGLMFTNLAIKQGPTYGYTLYLVAHPAARGCGLVHTSLKWIHLTGVLTYLRAVG